MSTTAKKIVETAQNQIGKNENNGSHRFFIDIYNSFKPLPRNYKVQYDDDWCAVFDSALAILTGSADIIPIECGVGEKIQLAQKMGIWVENDNYVPKMGDIVTYDWKDGEDYKETDNKGWPRHEGTVVEVNEEEGYFLVVEGNVNNEVSVRGINIGGRYIRGFICPKYEKEPVFAPSDNNTEKSDIVAGKEIRLINTKCYNSETASAHYGTKNGVFYLWDDVVKNNRIRITNRLDRVGVKGQVTCWVNISDLSLEEKKETVLEKPIEENPVAEKEEKKIYAGKRLLLKNAPSYTSETTRVVGKARTGIFFLWDEVVKNGRIRITNRIERVGVKGQVTCWIDVDSIE